jgi:translation initiation factor IF-2
MGEGRRQGSNVPLIAAALAGALGIVVAVPVAMAQAPADQYIPSPKPADTGDNARDPAAEQNQTASSDSQDPQTAFGPASEPPGGPGGDEGGGGSGGGAGKTAGANAGDDTSGGGGTGGGATDYPLTPFTAAVLGLLLLGLLARVAVGVRRSHPLGR